MLTLLNLIKFPVCEHGYAILVLNLLTTSFQCPIFSEKKIFFFALVLVFLKSRNFQVPALGTENMELFCFQ